jgi:hypothetical protein
VRILACQRQSIGFVGGSRPDEPDSTSGNILLSQQIELHHAVSIAIQDKSQRIPTLRFLVRNINGNN